MKREVNRFLAWYPVFLCMLLVPAPCVLGATLHVGPGGYATIQAAIDAALTGDSVVIADGVYTGAGNRDLDLMGKAITVRSENGAGGCTIDAGGVGWGFRLHSGETHAAEIVDLTISNATSSGIECVSASPTIRGCRLTGNSNQSGNGGGITCIDSTARIIGCAFDGNYARYGGGIYCEDSTVEIAQCTVTGNAVGFGRGGGIYCLRSDATITGCTVSGNEVVLGIGVAYVDVLKNGGGGIYLEDSAPEVTNCRILNNQSVGIWIPLFPFPISFICNGGGVFCYGSDPVLVNCLIAQNHAVFSQGGGIYAVDSAPSMINCTVSDNVASILGLNPGGGMYAWNSSVTAVNSIFWQDAVGEINYSGTAPVVSYSAVQGGYPGTGNIDAAPNFADAAGGDYHLRRPSPCIDAGGDPGTPVGPVDFEGDPRVVDGDCNASVVIDMGADEYVKACACDLNNDCRCDMRDWLIFGQDWGRTDCLTPGVTCECDINADGRCDMNDWLLFGANWGSTDCTRR